LQRRGDQKKPGRTPALPFNHRGPIDLNERKDMLAINGNQRVPRTPQDGQTVEGKRGSCWSRSKEFLGKKGHVPRGALGTKIALYSLFKPLGVGNVFRQLMEDWKFARRGKNGIPCTKIKVT